MEKWMFSTNKSRVKMEELRKLRRNDFRFLSRALYKRASLPQGVCREKHASMCRLASPRNPSVSTGEETAENYCAEIVYKEKNCNCLLPYHEFLPSPYSLLGERSLFNLNRDESEKALQRKRRGLTGSFQRRGAKTRALGLRPLR
jgi:hypothetical protein